MSDERSGLVAGISAYLLWGFLTLYWHELSGLSAFELIGQRIVWSALALWIVHLALRRKLPLAWLRHDHKLLLRVLAAAVLLAANWTTYVWCVTNDNVVETALGYFIAPLGTVLVGVFVLRERLRRAQVAALALAGLAVVVLTVGYGRLPVYALILGVTWAVYGLLKKLVPLNALESLTAETFVLLPFAIAVVVGFELAGDAIRVEASTLQLVLVPLSGIVTTAPLLLFAMAAKRVPLTTLGPLQYLVPTINFVLGVVVYGEDVGGWKLAGFAIVWVALVIFTVDSVRHARSSRLARQALEPAGVEG